MNSFFGYAALGGFTLALSVHLASLFGIDVQSKVPIVWALHVGVFIVFVPMFFQLIKSNFMADRFALIRGIPVWSIVVSAILIAYAFLNFFLAFSGAADGFPAVQNGVFVLEQKGQLVHNFSEAEYHSRQASVLRGFSGHWLIFYFVPFAHFVLRRKA